VQETTVSCVSHQAQMMLTILVYSGCKICDGSGSISHASCGQMMLEEMKLF